MLTCSRRPLANPTAFARWGQLPGFTLGQLPREFGLARVARIERLCYPTVASKLKCFPPRSDGGGGGRGERHITLWRREDPPKEPVPYTSRFTFPPLFQRSLLWNVASRFLYTCLLIRVETIQRHVGPQQELRDPAAPRGVSISVGGLHSSKGEKEGGVSHPKHSGRDDVPEIPLWKSVVDSGKNANDLDSQEPDPTTNSRAVPIYATTVRFTPRTDLISAFSRRVNVTYLAELHLQ